MLHPKLETEKEKNYPTVRAILSKYYGLKFKEAKIEAVSAGQLSYGFMVKLSEEEEYFFKIDREKSSHSAVQETRKKATFKFMNFMHEQHQKNRSYVNSAYSIHSLEGMEFPELEAFMEIPMDLIGHQMSLVTKIPGHGFLMSDDALKKKDSNPFNLTNYPLDVALAMINNIVDIQQGGKKFCELNPELASDFEDEGTRAIPRSFDIIQQEIQDACTVPVELLETSIEKQRQKLIADLNSICQQINFKPQIEPNSINDLQAIFTAIAHHQGLTEFSKERFSASMRSADMSGILGEPLTSIGKYIHQLGDAYTLLTWLKDGTAKTIMEELAQFKEAYELVYRLEKAKTVSHDANVTNFIIDDQKQITRIDLVDFLSSGQRIYDLSTNLRNTCPQTDSTKVCPTRAKIMVEQFDNRERLTNKEVKSIWTLFKAVELGNKPNGLATLISRAARIIELGNTDYDCGIITQFSLDAKKKVIDLDNQRIAKNDLSPIVDAAREQTVKALNLHTASAEKPKTILGSNGLFSAPTKQQERMLDTVEYDCKAPKL
jgi:hypothetical protein